MNYRSLDSQMGVAVAARTVFRTNPERENWGDVATRVAVGNLLMHPSIQPEYLALRDHIAHGRILMSGRHLQHGDASQPTRNLEVHANCATAATSFMLFYLLLNGSGVGRSYDDELMLVDWSRMPLVVPVFDATHPDYLSAFLTPEQAFEQFPNALWFSVADSREGWAKALEFVEVLTSRKVFRNAVVILDFSKVRAKGQPIKGMQGRPSSGPVPLMEAFASAIKLARIPNMPAWKRTMYIDHFFADAVQVGGARRSARMAVKSYTDPDILDFVNCKQEGGLWTANNSVGVDAAFWEQSKQPGTRESVILQAILYAQYHHATGEPGIINLDQLHRDMTGFDTHLTQRTIGNSKYPIDTDDTTELYTKLAGIVSRMKYPSIVNPCVTDDTWITTSEGPKQVKQLLQGPFVAVVNGQSHPATAFWCTGSKPVVTVRTQRGYQLTATENHKVKVAIDGVETWKELSELRPGDQLVLQNQRDNSWTGIGTFAEGWLLGEIVGDGGYNPDKYPTYLRFWGEHSNELLAYATAAIQTLPNKARTDCGSGIPQPGRPISIQAKALDTLAEKYLLPETKTLLPTIETTSEQFHCGFLRGLFDSDGTVIGNNIKGASVRVAQVKVEVLEIAQRMLARLGVVSTLYRDRKVAGFTNLPDGKGGTKVYPTQSIHELVVSRNNIDVFATKIGFTDPGKLERLHTILQDRNRPAYRETFLTTVTEVVAGGTVDVYDCSVDTVHEFDANGLSTHNCGEIPLNVLGGYCVIADVVPFYATKLSDALDAFRIATRALMRVNKMESLYHGEIARTNRIGVGFTGIHEFMWKHFGITFPEALDEYGTGKKFWEFLDKARRLVEMTAEAYAVELGVNVPHTFTTVKPAGTTSKLFSLTEGAHLPTMRQYLRWVQFREDDPLVEEYRGKGYPIIDKIPEGTTGTGYTKVKLVGFPTEPLICTLGIPDDLLVTANDATIDQQYEWVRLIEKYWLGPRGNQVSYTLKYNKSAVPFEEYCRLIAKNQPTVRCTSLLASDDWQETRRKYGYVPEEPISRDYYDWLLKHVEHREQTINLEDLQCANGACPI